MKPGAPAAETPGGTPAEESCRRYPADVEAWWVARARAVRGGGSPASARVAAAAGALSDLFTTERPERFPDYGADPLALAAYGLFFFPRTWCQVRFPLAEALDLRGWRPGPGRAVRILDLGCGAGAAGLSAARFLLARDASPAARVVGLDRSEGALAAFAALAREAPPAHGVLEAVARRADLADAAAALEGEAPFDLVVVAHAANEAWAGLSDEGAAAWLARAAGLLGPGGLLLVVEPALRTTALRLRRVAATAVEGGGLFAWSPETGPSPWRPREDGRFWPHEVRRWSVPRSLAVVNRALRRSVEDLSFAFGLLSRAAPPDPFAPGPDTLRLTSPVARARGRWRWTGLAADGAEHGYDLLQRTTTPEDRRRLAHLERGDVLRAEGLVASGGAGSWRVPTAAALVSLWHPR